MSNFTVKINIPELKAALAQIDKYDTMTRARIGSVIQKSCTNIANGARSRIHSRNGDLAQSITSRVDLEKLVGYVEAKKFYGPMVEFGHKGTLEKPAGKKALAINGGAFAHANIPAVQAYPFIRPAYEEEKPNLINGINQVVQND
jgi:hypothetical protein